jgi:hypothetical protein
MTLKVLPTTIATIASGSCTSHVPSGVARPATTGSVPASSAATA